MAEIIEAQVIQKIATPEEWATDTRIPYKGEIMLVGDSTGKVVNIKVGDGFNVWSLLEYMFDSIQQNVNYYPVNTLALPTPEGDNVFSLVVEGVYTFGGVEAFTVPIGEMGIIYWNGTDWNLEQTIPFPTGTPTGEVSPSETGAVSGGTIFFQRASKEIELLAPEILSAYTETPETVDGFLKGVGDNGYFIGSSGEFVPDPLYYTTQFQKYIPSGNVSYRGEIDGFKPSVVGFDKDFNYLGIIRPAIVSNGGYTSIPVSIPNVDYIKASFLTNGNESILIPSSGYSFNLTIKNPQLFNKNAVVTQGSGLFGYMSNRYISNSNGALNTSAAWYTANIPLEGYEQTRIFVEGVTTFIANKWGRFENEMGETLSYMSYTTLSTLGAVIPEGATAFMFTVKHANDPVNVLDTVMISFDKSPYEDFRPNPSTLGSVLGIPVGGNSDTGKISTQKTIMSAGDSITKNGDGTGVLKGYQLILKDSIDFPQYYSYGYPGSPFTARTTGGSSIIQQRTAWTVGDINTLLVGTNDFKLNIPIGDFQTDYVNGVGLDYYTFYGALRVYVEYIYAQNISADIIFITPPQRDNGGYNTYFVNTAGHTLVDYADAMVNVGEYESIPVVDLLRNTGINLRNLSYYTSDGLHPNDIGYVQITETIEPEVLKVL